ncbi:hypothetical protein P775_10695 [Puniceibacterium antarcticum]|uniref:HTH merR-type domain-containing protein n=1 Tax=Puniceibacterium antarcticum TaxID=1206336 RepID=A0A2G8RGC4_9RHOB|nr:chaperone modulator CbpM [Puniceibacterium antarcticum]PIL20128.1 hypothetical protein P775_10695 [Puniceibacterium antarcticum]
MKDRFSEEEVVTTITRLTRRQLVRFVEVEFVRPERAEDGVFYRRVDIARLELLCDLSQDLDMDEAALGVVISLIDQLHAVRQDLATISDALESLPPELRLRVAEALSHA